MTRNEKMIMFNVQVSDTSVASALGWDDIRKSIVGKINNKNDLEALILQCSLRLVILYMKDYKEYGIKEVIHTFTGESKAPVVKNFQTRCKNSLYRAKGYRIIIKILRALKSPNQDKIKSISKLRV